MSTLLKVSAGKWLLRGVPMLALVVGIGLAQAAPVVQAAGIDNSAAEITVYAPGAPEYSPVEVQYQDPSGNWLAVSGWTGMLNQVTGSGTAFKTYTVLEANFGQGPFRWVVYQMDGQTVWGISDTFNLPPGGGIEFTETIVPSTPSMSTTTTATPTPAAPASSSLLLNDAGSYNFTLDCPTACDSSVISGYFLGIPANSWIAVQWGDGLGNWTTVDGWQGTADTTDSTTGQLIKHFSVDPANYGQGPFRWAVYDMQGGTLIGYSDNFTLPTYNGVDEFMSFAK